MAIKQPQLLHLALDLRADQLMCMLQVLVRLMRMLQRLLLHLMEVVAGLTELGLI